MASIIMELFSSILLFSLVLGMTITVEISHMQQQLHNYTALCIGVFIQFIVLPFITFLTIHIFSLSQEIAIILLVITSSPGGSYSNWWCNLWNAELALSVTMTAISSMMAIIMLPLNLLIYTHLLYNNNANISDTTNTTTTSGTTTTTTNIQSTIDWSALFVTLIVVLSAICTGLYISYTYTQGSTTTPISTSSSSSIELPSSSSTGTTVPIPDPSNTTDTTIITNNKQNTTTNNNNDTISKRCCKSISKDDIRRYGNQMGNISGILLITLSICISSSSSSTTTQSATLLNQSMSFYIGCAVPPILGLCVVIMVSTYYQLPKPERVAICIESCYQNTGIATTVALTMFQTESQLATAIGVPLYYGIIEASMIIIFGFIAWRMGWTKAPIHDNCCKVITTSYEVVHEKPSDDESTVIEVVLGDHHHYSTKHDIIFTRTFHDGPTPNNSNHHNNNNSSNNYIVDEQSIQHHTTQNVGSVDQKNSDHTQKHRQYQFGFEIDDTEDTTTMDEIDDDVNIHESNSIPIPPTMDKDDDDDDDDNNQGHITNDGIMKFQKNYNYPNKKYFYHHRRKLYGTVQTPPESPTLTETTIETIHDDDDHDNIPDNHITESSSSSRLNHGNHFQYIRRGRKTMSSTIRALTSSSSFHRGGNGTMNNRRYNHHDLQSIPNTDEMHFHHDPV